MILFPSPIAHITNPAGIHTSQITLHSRKYYRVITPFGRVKNLTEVFARPEAFGTHSPDCPGLARHSRALTWHDSDSHRYAPSRLSSLQVTPIITRWNRRPYLTAQAARPNSVRV